MIFTTMIGTLNTPESPSQPPEKERDQDGQGAQAMPFP